MSFIWSFFFIWHGQAEPRKQSSICGMYFSFNTCSICVLYWDIDTFWQFQIASKKNRWHFLFDNNFFFISSNHKLNVLIYNIVHFFALSFCLPKLSLIFYIYGTLLLNVHWGRHIGDIVVATTDRWHSLHATVHAHCVTKVKPRGKKKHKLILAQLTSTLMNNW